MCTRDLSKNLIIIVSGSGCCSCSIVWLVYELAKFATRVRIPVTAPLHVRNAVPLPGSRLITSKARPVFSGPGSRHYCTAVGGSVSVHGRHSCLPANASKNAAVPGVREGRMALGRPPLSGASPPMWAVPTHARHQAARRPITYAKASRRVVKYFRVGANRGAIAADPIWHPPPPPYRRSPATMHGAWRPSCQAAICRRHGALEAIRPAGLCSRQRMPDPYRRRSCHHRHGWRHFDCSCEEPAPSSPTPPPSPGYASAGRIGESDMVSVAVVPAVDGRPAPWPPP